MKYLALTIALLGSLLAGRPSGFAQSATFTTNSLPLGLHLYWVATADVKGAGRLDLISANFDDNTLTVLTNNGSGGFGSNATCQVGLGPSCVVAADINGDRKPDLISANYNASTLTLLTNDGSGGFGSNATLNVGSEPICVIAADVNGDQKLALISANFLDGTLTVLTNNGSGVFGANATLPVGSHPASVVAADVNGTGKLALISANSFDNSLTVLTNNGSGVFGSNATLHVGSEPSCVVAADVNGDGKIDLVCANSFGNTLSVFTNNGSGRFVLMATPPVGNTPSSVVVADVNGDGKPELICANQLDNTLTVLTNNGSGGFGSNATLHVGSGPNCVVAADVNGDGKPDLIAANSFESSLTLLLNTTTPSVPQLSVIRTGSQVVLAWSTNAANYVLQVATSLVAPNWANVITVPVVVGQQFVVTNTIAGGTVFYRLQLVTPPVAPLLNIARAGKQVVLSWPATATNYLLQVTTSLSAPNWANVTNMPVVVGQQFVVTNTLTGGNAFYRLVQATTTAAPVLSLARSGQQAVLSWPTTTATNYILQVTISLAAPNWTNTTNTPVVLGQQYVVTNAITGGSAFYRLKK